MEFTWRLISSRNVSKCRAGKLASCSAYYSEPLKLGVFLWSQPCREIVSTHLEKIETLKCIFSD